MDPVESLRYPIGRFVRKPTVSAAERDALIGDIGRLPGDVGASVADLAADRLDTPYRAGAWTVRQLVHHLADSHMHAYVRFKMAVTESDPAIRLHDVDGWAELPDSRVQDIEVSLTLLDALHRRWVFFLRSMSPEQFDRSFQHPARGRVTLDDTLQLYAWHGRHHLAHITSLRERMRW